MRAAPQYQITSSCKFWLATARATGDTTDHCLMTHKSLLKLFLFHYFYRSSGHNIACSLPSQQMLHRRSMLTDLLAGLPVERQVGLAILRWHLHKACLAEYSRICHLWLPGRSPS